MASKRAGAARGSGLMRSAWATLLGFVLPLVCLPAATLACLWDRDTLRYEAKGLPGIVEVIMGRFEREPPLYYEMRLERVTRELAADPTRLDLYDDAGVACDRLHRGDEAVEWMAKKKAAMDALPGTPTASGDANHLYRYHANLGTFLAHRWLRGGADRAAMQDMLDGRDHIKRAIEINPDAHFGREKYQLLAMEWIIEQPMPEKPGNGSKEEPYTIFDAAPADERLLVRDMARFLSPETDPIAKEATPALAGLIVMGDAWQSADIFNALARSLESRGHSSVAFIAVLRAQELARAGRPSMHPSLREQDPEFLARIDGFGLYFVDYEGQETGALKAFFDKARTAADEWHTKRTAFMTERLQAGRHPDTDPTFWDGYRETKPPTPPGSLKSGEAQLGNQILLALGVVLLLGIGSIVCAVWLVRRVVARRRR